MIVAVASCCHRRKLSSVSLNEIRIKNFVGENVGEEYGEEAREVIGAAMEVGDEVQKPWIEKKRWLCDTMLNNLEIKKSHRERSRESIENELVLLLKSLCNTCVEFI